MSKYKILIIEDEQGIREGLEIILSPYFTITTAANGIEGLKKSFKDKPDLILLDLKMPDMDGFQVCKALREDHDFDRVPIIILTAFNISSDRTRLFDLGADDYITKPFDTTELIARIQRALSRLSKDVKLSNLTPDPSTPTIIKHGELKIDGLAQKVFIGDKLIALSSIEFKLLYLLAINFNQAVAREKILEDVWEKQQVSARLIDPHILALREKLKGYHFSIQAIYGKGYILKNL